jgi:hypothetical protein
VLRNYSGSAPAAVTFAGASDALEAFFYAQRLPDFLEYDAADPERSLMLAMAVPAPVHVHVAAPPAALAAGAPLRAVAAAAGARLRGRAVVLAHALRDGEASPMAEFFRLDPAAPGAQVVGAQIVSARRFVAPPGAADDADALVAFADAVAAGTAERIAPGEDEEEEEEEEDAGGSDAEAVADEDDEYLDPEPSGRAEL